MFKFVILNQLLIKYNICIMSTFQISDNVFNSYQFFLVRNKEVSASEAYAFVVNAREKSIKDFNIARMLKVKKDNTIISLLNLLTIN